jgi:hypothetical protein
MDKALIHGKMVPSTQVNGTKIESMVKVNTPGMMEGSTMETGKTTTWMDTESTLGKTAVSTRGSTKRTRSTAMVFTLGPMVENMTASG